MADVVVVGAGLVGLGAGLLLAGDGHQVTVLERDPGRPPAVASAWASWERRGVNQFRLPHVLLARFRQEVEAELPEVAAALAAAGACRINLVDGIPESITGGRRPGDEAFTWLTGRRPVVEAAVAAVADATANLTVRRGQGVAELLTRGPVAGPPIVTGVRTEGGEEIRAQVVVDAGGRRSAMRRWLARAGAAAPAEEADDSGFAYYGRHFAAEDGALPTMLGPPLQHHPTVSTLTLPADNGTWAVVVVTHAGDRALRGLRRPERWQRAVAAFPLVAHWAAGRPLDDSVATMAGIEDRRRRLVVDGRPVVGGVLLVGDAWACTNPSLGRGASLGLMHAVALRDYLRSAPADPVALVEGWEAATEAAVGGYLEDTRAVDRARLAEMEAALAGRPPPPAAAGVRAMRTLDAAGDRHPDLLRASIEIANVLARPAEVVSRPELAGPLARVDSDGEVSGAPGPDRGALVALASG